MRFAICYKPGRLIAWYGCFFDTREQAENKLAELADDRLHVVKVEAR